MLQTVTDSAGFNYDIVDTLTEGGQDSIIEVKVACLGEEHPKIKIPGPPGWRFGVRLTTSPYEKAIVVNAQEKKFGRNYRPVSYTHLNKNPLSYCKYKV